MTKTVAINDHFMTGGGRADSSTRVPQIRDLFERVIRLKLFISNTRSKRLSDIRVGTKVQRFGLRNEIGGLNSEQILLNPVRCASCGRSIPWEQTSYIVLNHETLHHVIDKILDSQASAAFDKLHKVLIAHCCASDVQYYTREEGEVVFLPED